MATEILKQDMQCVSGNAFLLSRVLVTTNSTLTIIGSAHALSNYLNVTNKRPVLLFILVNSAVNAPCKEKWSHISGCKAT